MKPMQQGMFCFVWNAVKVRRKLQRKASNKKPLRWNLSESIVAVAESCVVYFVLYKCKSKRVNGWMLGSFLVGSGCRCYTWSSFLPLFYIIVNNSKLYFLVNFLRARENETKWVINFVKWWWWSAIHSDKSRRLCTYVCVFFFFF